MPAASTKLLPDAALAALIVPWRRRELTHAGLMLACLTAAWDPIFAHRYGALAHTVAACALAVAALLCARDALPRAAAVDA